jgi:uncharacterized damage-inducible protein DinB
VSDLKTILHSELRRQRDAVRGKLDGLSERDVRSPRTPTGTNLLGLLKHCAATELGYFGDTFGRPSQLPFPWDGDGVSPDDNLDMFATEDESMNDVLVYADACFAHADATITALDIDAEGEVAWWPPERRQVTLGQILIHVALDEARHAGHADIVREGLDGVVGFRSPGQNLPGWSAQQWATYVERLQRIADARPNQP